METFKPDIEEWINLNLKLGNCKVSMFKTLLELGYKYSIIRNKLNIDYNDSKSDQNSNSKSNIKYNKIRNFIEEIQEMMDELDQQKTQTVTNNKSIFKLAMKNADIINVDKLDICRIKNFLTKEECEEIIKIIDKSNLQESSTFNASSPDKFVKDTSRTSKTCYFDQQDKIINDLEERMAKVLGVNNKYAEKIQGQKYEIGQEFKKHVDFFGSHILNKNPSIIGERTWTFMVYLNDVEEGGYTSFPYAYFASKPERGTAIIWNNLNKDGTTNDYATHMGMPIIKGVKYILTKWFKNAIIYPNIPNQLCENNYLPIFHPIGFEKIKLDLNIIKNIKEWMNENNDNFEDEPNEGHIKANTTKVLHFSKAPQSLQLELVAEMQKLLTKWIGYKSELTHVATYGIREYKRGSSLKNHYDKKDTHVISAIIHLDDKCDKKWPLYIEDHNYKPHDITMEFGDVVFYESTTCKHGRPTEFEGEYHRNMYIHFRPDRWLL
jgi:prolyl 4-hydroxylase